MSTKENELPKTEDSTQLTSSEVQPQTPSPNDQVINRDSWDDATKTYLSNLENALKEQRRTISDLSTKVQDVGDKITKQEEAANVLDPDEARNRYFANPIEETAKLVKKEMSEQIAPLLTFVKSFQSTSKLDQAKNAIKNDPRFKNAWGSDIDSHIDAVFSNGQIDPTEENIAGVVVQALGLRMLSGNVTPPVNNPTPPKQETTVVTPPNIRPSNPLPPTPKQSNGPQLRDLTENEWAIARMNFTGTKEEVQRQYLAWMDVPSSQVVHSNIGLEDKK